MLTIGCRDHAASIGFALTATPNRHTEGEPWLSPGIRWRQAAKTWEVALSCCGWLPVRCKEPRPSIGSARVDRREPAFDFRRSSTVPWAILSVCRPHRTFEFLRFSACCIGRPLIFALKLEISILWANVLQIFLI